MIVIETCPKCGHDLLNTVICTYPPIPRKECPNCDWYWEGEREEVMRVPFGGNSLNATDNTNNCLDSLLNSYVDINGYNLEDATINNFTQSACENCSNNPKNDGSGICHCTLGQMQVTY